MENDIQVGTEEAGGTPPTRGVEQPHTRSMDQEEVKSTTTARVSRKHNTRYQSQHAMHRVTTIRIEQTMLDRFSQFIEKSGKFKSQNEAMVFAMDLLMKRSLNSNSIEVYIPKDVYDELERHAIGHASSVDDFVVTAAEAALNHSRLPSREESRLCKLTMEAARAARRDDALGKLVTSSLDAFEKTQAMQPSPRQTSLLTGS